MKESKKQQTEVTVLQQIRDDLGLSREGLAQIIGCSAKTIERAEKGEREPQLTVLQWKKFHRFLKAHKKTLPDRLSEKVAV